MMMMKLGYPSSLPFIPRAMAFLLLCVLCRTACDSAFSGVEMVGKMGTDLISLGIILRNLA
jgi:hypothetical protein